MAAQKVVLYVCSQQNLQQSSFLVSEAVHARRGLASASACRPETMSLDGLFILYVCSARGISECLKPVVRELNYQGHIYKQFRTSVI